MIRNPEFAEIVLFSFAGFEEIGFSFRKINAHFVVIESEKLEMLVKYDDYSGYVPIFFQPRQGEDGFSLEEVAEAMRDPLRDYRHGIYAYEKKNLEACLPRVAAVLKESCQDLFNGERHELARLHAVARKLREAELHDMMYGGLRYRADNAWNAFDYNKYINLIERIPEEHRTASEGRRMRIARIKTGMDK